ncbi:DUF4177 domain-containing protein [Pendulispora rubella]|uniref:DUF4177 domain-containing protein n=1 Tax=Pendulispora rubella TaxID=2741070 RepID=A0ABZ2L4N7_9BACT
MRTFLVSLLFLLSLPACGTQTIGASSEGTVPKMPAGANLPRWEHLCMGGWGESTYSDFLNEAGEQGWELVGMTHTGLVCFKRPKAASAKPQAPAAAPTAPTSSL